MNWAKSLLTRKRFQKSNIILGGSRQSVTSRLENSRYRDFSQFFESIGLGLENFGHEKMSRYRSQKYLVSKKVSVSVSKIFGLEKKSRYRSQKFWSRKKS